MPDYGDIIFSPDQIWVASLESEDGEYGTPAYIEYPQDGGYTPSMDNDMIKAGGANVEALSVHTGAEITIKEASMREDAISIIEGESSTESGTSGNRVKTRVDTLGGPGLPYIGMVQVFNATNGAKYVVGFAKVKAKNKQDFKAEQNKFRTGEMKFDVLATAPYYKAMVRRKYENAADVPDFSDATEFENYMAPAWS